MKTVFVPVHLYRHEAIIIVIQNIIFINIHNVLCGQDHLVVWQVNLELHLSDGQVDLNPNVEFE